MATARTLELCHGPKGPKTYPLRSVGAATFIDMSGRQYVVKRSGELRRFPAKVRMSKKDRLRVRRDAK